MSQRTPPQGYASTECWRLFEQWADAELGASAREHGRWGPFWAAFRDGYSAGLLEESK